MLTRSDIIRLALGAGGSLMPAYDYGAASDRMILQLDSLERFAALVAASERESRIAAQTELQHVQQLTQQAVLATKVAYKRGVEAGAAAEREACADICDDLHWNWRIGDTSGPKECADAIRARGEKGGS